MSDELRAHHNAWVRYAKSQGIDPSPEAEQLGDIRAGFGRGWIAALNWERRRRQRRATPMKNNSETP